MIELFIAKIKADIKVSDDIMIDTVVKAEEDSDEVDDEPNPDYISESDVIDAVSWKAPDDRLSSFKSELDE